MEEMFDDMDNDRDMTNFVEFFMPRIVDILTVFQADQKMLLPLARIPRHIPLAQYSIARHDQTHTELIEMLKSVYQRHSDDALLTEVALTLQHMCWSDESNPLARAGSVAVHELATELGEQLHSLVTRVGDVNSMGDELTATLTACTNRVARLYQHIRVNGISFTEELDVLLAALVRDKGPSMLTRNLLILCMLECVWNCAQLNWDTENSVDATKLCKEKLSLFYGHCEDVLAKHGDLDDSLLMCAMKTCSDILTLVSEKVKSKQWDAIYVEPSNKLVSGVYSYAQECIEDGDEGLLHELFPIIARLVVHNRRTMGRVCSLLLSCYRRFDTHCNDIVNAVMSKLRDLGDEVLLQAQLNGIKLAYATRSAKDVKTCASRMVLKFPMDPKRRSFLPYIKSGIDYAMEQYPDQFKFLTCAVLPYVKRCSRRDAHEAANYLMVTYDDVCNANDETRTTNVWQHLDQFVTELFRKAGRAPPKARTSHAKEPSESVNELLLMSPGGMSGSIRTPARTPRRKRALSNDDDDDDEGEAFDTLMRTPSPVPRRARVESDSAISDQNKKNGGGASVPRRRRRRFE